MVDVTDGVVVDLRTMRGVVPEPRVYFIPRNVESSVVGERWRGDKIEYNHARRNYYFAKVSGVNLNDYHPIGTWQYKNLVYKKK